MGRMKWFYLMGCVMVILATSIKGCPPKNGPIWDEKNSFIFRETGNTALDDSLKAVFNADGFTIVKQCHCSPDVLLYGADDNGIMDWHERVRGNVAKLGSEEGGLNLDLSIPTRPVVPSMSGLQSNFKQLSGERKNNVTIAVLDTGLDYRELGADSIPLTSECLPWPNTGREVTIDHGNKVALAAGDVFIRTGLENIYSVRLLDFNIFHQSGKGSLYDALCALRHAETNDADVVVASWGFYERTTFENSNDSTSHIRSIELLKKELQTLENREIPVVAAAGNGITYLAGRQGVNIDSVKFYPASFASDSDHMLLMAVGAKRSTAESYESYSNHGERSVRVFALDTVSYGTEVLEGTSYAAPRVAAAVAILRAGGSMDKFSDLKAGRIHNAFPNKPAFEEFIFGHIYPGDIIPSPQ